MQYIFLIWNQLIRLDVFWLRTSVNNREYFIIINLFCFIIPWLSSYPRLSLIFMTIHSIQIDDIWVCNSCPKITMVNFVSYCNIMLWCMVSRKTAPTKRKDERFSSIYVIFALWRYGVTLMKLTNYDNK